ncbi:DUF2309 domain-containing protein [Bacillus sp. REN16]|uniref:DUF2309 domain-containing protein n=1 Tax=Bacillus sp. REN16 TaxID=2887296 RepID=UPI001E375122|nr:putative inorganic carbon transporter subunit DabA [Bacillus sp. REN16]MCC3358133.1 Na-translocating system protein MpsB [Bacillus sp. REN16]
MSTILAKDLYVEKELDAFHLGMNDLVDEASKVIVPIGPIHTFAARSPWAGLEQRSFEQVARRLNDVNNLNIYPSETMLQTARNQGEIDLNFLEIGLNKWLDSQSLELSRESAEQYCKAVLFNEATFNQLEASELKRLVKKAGQFKLQFKNDHTVRTYSQRLEQLGEVRVAKELAHHVIKWCKLYLDESQDAWSMPSREEGFYHAWRKLVKLDPALNAKVRKQLDGLPFDAEFALKEVLNRLEIPFPDIQEYLEAHLLAMPGWAGMMLWRSQQSPKDTDLLMEYLAIRVSMEWALTQPYLPLKEQNNEDKINLETLITACVRYSNLSAHEWNKLPLSELKARITLGINFDEMTCQRLWMEAWEKTYEHRLMNLVGAKQKSKKNENQILAQFVFCIDVRSEPFRRKLEESGPFETFGTAGFFGLPIETKKLCSNHSHQSLPVMNKPQLKVIESLPEIDLKHYEQRVHSTHSPEAAFQTMKHNLFSSLVLPEISGPWLGLQTLVRSFIPRSTNSVFRKARKKWLRKPSAKLSLDHVHHANSELPVGFSEAEKVHYVEQSLRMMGLTENFAPLIVICGHGSRSMNNPYASSLDCGACGGASGEFNARVLAALCNLPTVRKNLSDRGIYIPNDTVFVASEHITSLDELHWVYVPELSESARGAFENIQKALPKVSQQANAERMQNLPTITSKCKNPSKEAVRFADDWSEVRPEWGLARNAAFIIGERELTKECNLNGEVFLHNYSWKKDKYGELLSNIIAGPATVSQWINLQYYASTIAPHYYGSGNKATQTVTSGIGVMQGNASDLLTGLPWQSVMKSDDEYYHKPIRLLVVIQAPKKYVEKLLGRDPLFHQKVQNGWIRLASIDQEGHWESWS